MLGNYLAASSMYYKPKFINLIISEDILLHLIIYMYKTCYSFHTYCTELKYVKVHKGTPRIGQFLLYLKVTVKCLVLCLIILSLGGFYVTLQS